MRESQAHKKNRITVVVRGAGDLATGVIVRLHRCGFRVLALEIPEPTVVRRTVALAESVVSGACRVEGVEAVRVESDAAMEAAWAAGQVPVAVDPDGAWIERLKPDAVVDAILAKRNLGTRLEMAPVVIGLGPGFTAGSDVHAVVETNRGHRLGRVYYSGAAEPDTGVPGEIGGHSAKRILRAPVDGVLENVLKIGDTVSVGDCVARVSGIDVCTEIKGQLRGLAASGLKVRKGMKIGDVDPRGSVSSCAEISDKALSVAGGVLEALLHLLDTG